MVSMDSLALLRFSWGWRNYTRSERQRLAWRAHHHAPNSNPFILPSELTSERAADAYATQLDNLRRQGQTATGRMAIPDARPADSYADQLDTLRQQAQTAAPTSAGYEEHLERLRLNDALHAPRQLEQSSQDVGDHSATDQSISDPYQALKVRQLEQAEGIEGRSTAPMVRNKGGATLSAQERYQRLKARQIEH